MSNVKMCDDCEAIYPEGVDGASVGSHYDPDTNRNIADDWCPDCTAKRRERKSSAVWRKSDPEQKSLEP